MPSIFVSVSLALVVLISTSSVPCSALERVASSPSSPGVGQTMVLPLQRRTSPARTPEEWGKWCRTHREHMNMKYGDGEVTKEKRGRGTNLLTNQNSDSSFFGSLALGTPPVSYDVILDTGSSDLWVADSNCSTTACTRIPTFNPASSSSFLRSTTPFSITYGSGEAAGTLGSDVVQMAGFSVSNQTFALCDTLSSGLLTAPVSGLLGLGWNVIAASGAMPFWQALAKGGAWNEPVMAFQLTRFVNNSKASTLEAGGSFTMGFLNSSLYTGDIEYIDLAAPPSYWILPLTSLSVKGNSIQAPAGQQALAAIDTGTTLVGGPSQFITSIYEQIPGATPGRGNFKGYYIYPCSATANITVSFGGRSWPISEEDFRLAQLTATDCLGAFFQLTTGQSAPSWIFGDTFLKNVYSVFRYSPPSIGFAELSSGAMAQSDANAPVPSATIGSAAASVTATGIPTGKTSSAWGLGRRVSTGGVTAALVLVGSLF